jgi:endogenous inhibitor of DNA gyrase (YacG/DUF329 family)
MNSFGWRVPAGGFNWIDGTRVENKEAQARREMPAAAVDSVGPYLVRNRRTDKTEKEYDPFTEEPELFRTFVATSTDRHSILAFANQFGPLGRKVDVVTTKQTKFFPTPTKVSGEAHGRWKAAIDTMRRALVVWDLCKKGNVRRLARLIHWVGEEAVWYKEPASKSSFSGPWLNEFEIAHRKPVDESGPGSPKNLDPEFARLTPGDVLLPAILYVQRQINANLPQQASPELFWTPRTITLSLGFRPRTLSDMLWLQFALTVTGEIAFRKCRVCGLWDKVGSGSAYANREFCSNACKMKDLRWRQSAASSMSTDGKPVKEIAHALRSDVRTVRKWLNPQKKEEK